jgi:VWFA-related protein
VAASVAIAHAQQRPTAPQQTQPQRPPRYDERVDVSSIVVDVRVIDELGAPVLGLSASDFVVTIGGRPAKVQSSVWTGEPMRSTATMSQAPPPLNATSGATAGPRVEPGQLVVLFFQKSLVNERARGFVRMVEQSRELVRQLPASTRVAVLTFESSLRVWSDFTDDRAAIDRILEHGLLHEHAPASVPTGAPSLVRGLTPTPKRIATIERAFASIGDALRPLPGSKAIAFIGYGMGALAFGSRQDLGATHAVFGAHPQELASNGDTNNEYVKAWRALTAARVSVFSLDITNADTHTLATGMQIIAADTGGFYASSLDFPEKPMRLVTSALNGHYVLFVEPPAEPAERTIGVSVTADRRASVYATSSYRSSARP